MPVATTATARVSKPAMALAAVAGVLMAGTFGLWAYHGTTVFFEMVRAGWIACF